MGFVELPVQPRASKEAGDKDHLKIFANADAAGTWFEEYDPEGGGFVSMRSWSELYRPVFQN